MRPVDSRTARGCSPAFGLIRSDVSADAAAVAFRSAVDLRNQERLRRPEIEIVWSGPEADRPLVRQRYASEGHCAPTASAAPSRQSLRTRRTAPERESAVEESVRAAIEND